MNFVVKTFDLSKKRDNKNFALEGNFYNSFVVTKLTGACDIKLSRTGDWLTLGTEVNKMSGVSGFNEIWLRNTAQNGAELKIIFGQNISNTDFDAFRELSQLGVDVNTTPALKAGDLNLDSNKNVGTDLNAESLGLMSILQDIKGLLQDIKTNTSA